MTQTECPYEYTFVAYTEENLDPEKFPDIKYIKRTCIKGAGHSGNHIVLEPLEGSPLEVPRWGYY